MSVFNTRVASETTFIGDVQIDQDLTVDDSLLVGHTISIIPPNGIVNITPCQFYISNIGDICSWLNADTDNISESDVAYQWFTQDRGFTAMRIANESISNPGSNVYTFTSGAVAAQGFSFQTANISSATDGVLPTFLSPTDRFRITPTAIHSFVDLDMNGNNIGTVENITADQYYLSTVAGRFSEYTITGLIVSANTNTVLVDWTTVTTSLDVNVNPTTGIFTPENGVYSMIYQATSSVLQPTSELGVRLENNSGETIYQSIIATSDLMETENGNFQGAQFESMVSPFDGLSTYRIFMKCSNNGTFNLKVRITRLF